ncbi:MAG: hypothetical protein AAF449_01255 [Myxococcota bacterium]
MSGIGDSGDNSDLQRIREVNQAELRQRIDRQKRGQQARVERSFKEVMAERGREKMAQQAQREGPAPGQTSTRDPAGKRLLDQVRSQAQRNQGDLANKASMSRSFAGNLARARNKGHRSDAVTSETRAEESLGKATEELDHIKETERDEDIKEVRREEEKQAEMAADSRSDGPVQRDGQRQQQQRDRSGAEDQAPTEGVRSSDGPRAAHRVTVPPALIKQLVSAVFKAVGPDGRTQMQIHLRGGPLDGVKLEVRAENGKVQCTFHGCDREMKGLLQAGQKALASGLAKRGLKLEKLNVA